MKIVSMSMSNLDGRHQRKPEVVRTKKNKANQNQTKLYLRR